ncbi:MAG: T9SS type A sorting domain-containing protein [Sphingobacteriales bacterium JAD_PAG50586_3]|nr:MAG: T9SS type A sorting domain-containing protein [Sphingobacteriales bacterium JAD_PAG50586_3]
MSQALSCISQSSVICGQDIAIYKHHSITLSSIQDFWKGKVGFQQYPCVANVGTTAVYTASGNVTPDWEQRNDNNLNIHLPYVAQNKNLALIMYRPEPTPPLIGSDFDSTAVSLYWRAGDFDEVAEDSLWLLGRQAEGYVAVRRNCLNTTSGISACPTIGGQTWVIMVGDSGLYGNFTNFKNIVHNSTFTEDWYYDYVDSQYVYYAKIVMDTTTIEYAWGVDSTIATGVNEIADNDFTIYPNPAIDVLRISTNNIKGSCTIELFNISGQQVYSYTGNTQNIEVPVHNFSNGLYAVKLSTPDGKLITRKVVVAH